MQNYPWCKPLISSKEMRNILADKEVTKKWTVIPQKVKWTKIEKIIGENPKGQNVNINIIYNKKRTHDAKMFLQYRNSGIILILLAKFYQRFVLFTPKATAKFASSEPSYQRQFSSRIKVYAGKGEGLVEYKVLRKCTSCETCHLVIIMTLINPYETSLSQDPFSFKQFNLFTIEFKLKWT